MATMHAAFVGAALLVGLALIAVRATEPDAIAGQRHADVLGGDRDVQCVRAIPSRMGPGERTPWQANATPRTLVVTEGLLAVQFRDAEPVTVEPGDTLAVPSGQWHRHGAAGDEPASFTVRSACSDADADADDVPFVPGSAGVS